MPWTNADGLLVRFGIEEALVGREGEYTNDGPTRLEEVTLDLTTLTNTDQMMDTFNAIHKDGFIESVEIETRVAATSAGSATLSMGLYRSDGTTAIANNGLVNALALASLTPAGTRQFLTAGVTGAGTKIGSTPGFPAYVSARWNTAAFTAGLIAVRIRWSR